VALFLLGQIVFAIFLLVWYFLFPAEQMIDRVKNNRVGKIKRKEEMGPIPLLNP
jgi:hypothetical protein